MTATATATSPAATAATPATDLLLSPEQVRFFDVFGFLKLPGLFATTVTEVTEAFEQVWIQRGGGHDGKPHEGKARSCIVPFIDQSAVLSALLDHPGIHGAARSLLGDDFNYMGSDGNFYVGDTGWHPDGSHRVVRFLKMAIYLDPLTAANGCLRVIPGSHRVDDSYSREVLAAAMNPGSVGKHGSEIPAIALDTNPGDVLIFNHNTAHSAWNGGTRRRMFTINLCQHCPDSWLPQFQEYISSHARFLIERNVGPTMLATATPGRMRHLEQVMANDFLLTKKTRELVASGAEPARG
jgi:hypothetical protein